MCSRPPARSRGGDDAEEAPAKMPGMLRRLDSVDWDFEGSRTEEFTHGLHPYPAKFIPQIPRHLIQILCNTGDTVLDPFCGSGTALVEAVLMGRDAVGVDVNPLSALISKVKTTQLNQKRLDKIPQILSEIGEDVETLHGVRTLFADNTEPPDYPVPDYPKLTFWFKDVVIRELAIIKHHVLQVRDRDLQDFLKIVFSSILVTVSNQDSDTRYTRRDKKVKARDTVLLFARRVQQTVERMKEFALGAPAREVQAKVYAADARELDRVLEPQSIDLVVSSPPYPNAFTYHLYHRNRLFWLDMDPYALKKKEMGSHRKYSAKNGATKETFAAEMQRVFSGIGTALKSGKFCCMVIGDSIVRGELIRNNELLTEVARPAGFHLVKEIRRTIDPKRKAFNPTVGRIKEESILVFEGGK